MSDAIARISAALADRYRIERDKLNRETQFGIEQAVRSLAGLPSSSSALP